MGNLVIPAGGGVWENIGDSMLAAVASVAFTWGAAIYRLVEVPFYLLPATDNVDLWVRTSTDDGSAYDSGVSDYSWVGRFTEMDATPTPIDTGDNADAQIGIEDQDGIGSAANEGIHGILSIIHPSETDFTVIMFRGHGRTGGPKSFYTGAGVRLSAAVVNGVQLLFSAGNIASGQAGARGLL